VTRARIAFVTYKEVRKVPAKLTLTTLGAHSSLSTFGAGFHPRSLPIFHEPGLLAVTREIRKSSLVGKRATSCFRALK